MSDTKFTPGPWHWVDPDAENERCEVLLSGTGKEICDFGYYTQYYPTDGAAPSIEDRTLIAAAPDLYEALLIADKFCGSLTSDVCPDWVHIPIRSALAKARGENNG